MRINLSARAPGGEVLETAQPDPVSVGLVSHVTILIHGYNNSEDQATKTYNTFLANSKVDSSYAGEHVIYKFHWPGDKWGFLGYAISVSQAIKSGQSLHKFLANAFPRQIPVLTVIAHSLGSRVALEFVEAALAAGTPKFGRLRLCLMAAAVPVEKVVYSASLHRAATSATESRILFSPYDEALGWAFVMGEAIAGEHTTEAVGRTGGPSLVWSDPVDMTPYAHGEYWTHSESALEVRKLFDNLMTSYVMRRRPNRRVLRLTPLPLSRRLASRVCI